MTKVFVYGSLKSGKGNHKYYLSGDGAQFLGEVVTEEKYYVTGRAFPFLFGDEELEKVNAEVPVRLVRGELYDVDGPTLEALDRLEGHGRGFYERREINVRGEGKHETAWAYFSCLLEEIEGDVCPVKEGEFCW